MPSPAQQRGHHHHRRKNPAAVADALDTPITQCLMGDDQARNIAGPLQASVPAKWFDVTQPDQ